MRSQVLHPRSSTTRARRLADRILMVHERPFINDQFGYKQVPLPFHIGFNHDLYFSPPDTF